MAFDISLLKTWEFQWHQPIIYRWPKPKKKKKQKPQYFNNRSKSRTQGVILQEDSTVRGHYGDPGRTALFQVESGPQTRCIRGGWEATSPGPRLRPFPNYGHLNVLDSCLENLHLWRRRRRQEPPKPCRGVIKGSPGLPAGRADGSLNFHVNSLNYHFYRKFYSTYNIFQQKGNIQEELVYTAATETNKKILEKDEN